MAVILQEFDHSRVRTDLPDIKPGHIVKVYQKILEKKGSGKKQEIKERIQIFEGLVLGRKGGVGINATITVRKISGGIGVERVFPLSAPTIEKIELVKIIKTRRAKLSYMRTRVGRATRPKGEMIKAEENEKEKPEEAVKKEENNKEEVVDQKEGVEIKQDEGKKENVREEIVEKKKQETK